MYSKPPSRPTVARTSAGGNLAAQRDATGRRDRDRGLAKSYGRLAMQLARRRSQHPPKPQHRQPRPHHHHDHRHQRQQPRQFGIPLAHLQPRPEVLLHAAQLLRRAGMVVLAAGDLRHESCIPSTAFTHAYPKSSCPCPQA